MVGSSKTPIAHYLSCKFLLPIFSNDAIRTEVQEDLLAPDQKEYEKRRDARVLKILKAGYSFIYDASIDREWVDKHKWLENYGYEKFIISIDLSKDFLVKLHKVKGYDETLKRIDELIADHNNFLANYGDQVNTRISDKDFYDRLEICAKEVGAWLNKK